MKTLCTISECKLQGNPVNIMYIITKISDFYVTTIKKYFHKHYYVSAEHKPV